MQAYQGDGILAATSQKKIIETARRFYQWTKSTYPKEFRGLSASWIDLLRPSRLAPPAIEHEYVSLDEMRQLVQFQVPDDDLALKRDQAAAALLFLSGMRASAFVSLPIQAIDLESRSIKQWPELGVKTKNHKRATTYLLPIPELFQVVANWDALVRSALPATASWYAPVSTSWGEQVLSPEEPGNN